MGLLDRFKSRDQKPSPAPVRAAVSPPVRTPREHSAGAVQPLSGWHSPGSTVSIAGYVIVGGMLYVGTQLAALSGGPDPALVNPALKVGRIPDRSGQGLTYWPGYATISPESRAAYLEWLASGRSDPRTPIGYVFLYFYGLERRILVDCVKPGPARAELPVLRSEITRLLSIYGGNHSFRGYATRLLSILDLPHSQRSRNPPAYSGEKWPVPLELRMSLGEFGRNRAPIPAHWALAWALFHPEIYPRTPVTRCPDEFTRLFSARYAAQFGPGMAVGPANATVTVEYRPASSGLPPVSWDSGLPDVFGLAAPAKRLAAIVDECTDSLDAYSRMLGRRPESKGTLAATALLPPVLINHRTEPVRGLLEFAEGRLAGADETIIDGADLVSVWTPGGPEKLSRQESTALTCLLDGLGIGVEPDPRFGGGPIGPGPAVLFRTGRDNTLNTASVPFTAAATLLRLAAAVATADQTSTAEQEYLLAHLESTLDLSVLELRRLRAYLHLLYAAPVKLTGLTSRLAVLQAHERESVATFCVTVAAADGVVAPGEVTTLTKIYRLLEMPADRVFQDIHAATATATATASAATAPITVQPAGKSDIGYLIPAPPARAQRESQKTKPGLVLDQAVIVAKLAETAKVSALLGSIFNEDEDESREAQVAAAVAAQPGVVLVNGLDAAHSQLLRALAARQQWTRSAVEAMCAELGLLPDGALDVLNDAAFESVGESVVDGEEHLEVNIEAVQEMQR